MKWKLPAAQMGPAALIGDLVQVTHRDIDTNSSTLVINNA